MVWYLSEMVSVFPKHVSMVMNKHKHTTSASAKILTKKISICSNMDEGGPE